MNESNMKILLGELPILNHAMCPYNDIVINFIADFGNGLRKNKEAAKFPDIMALAFWCRKANLVAMKNIFDNTHTRVGLGTVLHITPSNVPVNFVFSFLFGLLAGNGNIVRVPSKEFQQTPIIINILNEIISLPMYAIIKKSTAFISYGHNDDISKELSSSCNARIIWGGDNAINSIRSCGLAPRAREITFADRYSFAVVDSEAILTASTDDMTRLANNFYNDTFLMDQNACSSPHLVLWKGKDIFSAKKKFWDAVSIVTDSKYEVQPINSVDKYVKTCCDCMALDCINEIEYYGNNIALAQLNKLPSNIDELRGKCGYFFEYNIINFLETAKIINEKYQTLCYYGVDPTEIKQVIVDCGLKGIDRIVPIGKALDIGIIWDGYDIISTLSRIISVI